MVNTDWSLIHIVLTKCVCVIIFPGVLVKELVAQIADASRRHPIRG